MAITRGRPRLTPERYQERLEAYCARYRVAPLESGLPPFPSGQRETPQHREWIALYKAHHRIGRRDRGQCERCAAPASEGSVFCEVHRGPAADRTTSAEERRALVQAQAGRCPICGDPVEPTDPIDSHEGGGVRAILHPRCSQIAGLARAVGPAALDRLRSYLWPSKGKRSR